LETDVRSLIFLYRRALVALVPIVEEAQIPWRDGEAYDDWDAIAEALFDRLVLESARWSVAPQAREKVRLPRYGFTQADYSQLSFITVDNVAGSGRTAVFVRLGTSVDPFDTVIYSVADQAWRTTDEEVYRTPLATAEFSLAWLLEAGNRRLTSRLTLEV
jgi:hypothetical protein